MLPGIRDIPTCAVATKRGRTLVVTVVDTASYRAAVAASNTLSTAVAVPTSAATSPNDGQQVLVQPNAGPVASTNGSASSVDAGDVPAIPPFKRHKVCRTAPLEALRNLYAKYRGVPASCLRLHVSWRREGVSADAGEGDDPENADGVCVDVSSRTPLEVGLEESDLVWVEVIGTNGDEEESEWEQMLHGIVEGAATDAEKLQLLVGCLTGLRDK
jgi:hypothetical protein